MSDKRRELLESCRLSPLLWMSTFYPGITLRPTQLEVFKAFEDPTVRKVATVEPRGNGKTLESALLELWHLTSNADSLVYSVAGFRRQLESLVQEFRVLWSTGSRLRSLFPTLTITNEGISIAPGWRAVFATATQPENLEGAHSRGPSWVGIDESKSLPDAHLQSLLGIITSPERGDRLFATGTAGDPRGWFYQAWHGERHFWDRTFIFRASDIPHLKAAYREQVARVGAEDPIVRQQLQSEFVQLREYGVFEPVLLERAIGLDVNALDEYAPRFRRVGWDPARTTDSSVLCTMVGANVLRWDTLIAGDFMEEQIPSVVSHIHKFRINQVGVDTTGIGRGVFERLRQVLDGEDVFVKAFVSGARALDPERHANQKTAMVISIRNLLLDGRLGLPSMTGDQAANVERFIEEAAGVRLVEVGNGSVRSVDPQPSPDFFDAFLIAASLRDDVRRAGAAMIRLVGT